MSDRSPLDSRGTPLDNQGHFTAHRRRLGNRHPCIVENGTAILFPENYFSRVPGGFTEHSAEELTAHFSGTGYAGLIDIVHQIRV